MHRQARLNPDVAALYPGLEAGRWHTAAALAGRVKGTRIVREGPRAEFQERILPPEHFEFRGGTPRRGSWMGIRSRRLDRYHGGIVGHILVRAG